MGLRPEYEPARGVPDFLLPQLLEWFRAVLRDEDVLDDARLLGLVATKFRIPTEAGDSAGWKLRRILDEMSQNEILCLDLVDFMLRLNKRSDELQLILRLANHELTVSDDGKHLIERIPQTSVELYKSATGPVDHASDLLKSAWAKTYSRDKDPFGAWNDAKAAVENLLGPIVSPHDSKRTISKMAKCLRDTHGKWSCSLRTANEGDPVRAFAAALELVWYPPGNHGQEEEIDPAMSRAAVMQAVTICQWLRDGVLRPKG